MRTLPEYEHKEFIEQLELRILKVMAKCLDAGLRPVDMGYLYEQLGTLRYAVLARQPLRDEHSPQTMEEMVRIEEVLHEVLDLPVPDLPTMGRLLKMAVRGQT